MAMTKVSRTPSGFYTAKEAARRLGVNEATFYYQVKTGKIEKVVPPGKKEGYYPKLQVDKLAQAQELFLLLHSLEPKTYERASSEDDIQGIYDLCVAFYGISGTPTYETRLEIWRKNPDVYYVVKQEGIVVGYISLIWFDDEALTFLMGPTPKQPRVSSAGAGVYAVTGAEHVRPFVPGQPIDSLFISLAVRPGMTNTAQRDYAFKLLRDTLDVLEDLARRGMPVKKLLATSEKTDGIRLARKLGMRETRYEGDRLVRFEMNFETATKGLAKEYRDFVEALQQQEL